MTPKEITTLAHHRLVSPWVMKLVLEATAIERANTIEEAAKVCDEVLGENNVSAAIRGLK